MFRFGARSARTNCGLVTNSRRCSIEHLERRELLSGTPPTVVDVAVSSTAWTSTFFDYLESNSLGSGGYSIPTGSTAQTKPLPWNNLDQIKITFSEDVHVDAADFALSGINNIAYKVESFHYDAMTYVATWTLENSLTADRLMIDLDANGLDPIIDLDSNILDGEWVNSVSSGASGNSLAGGDFEFQISVLPGDVNQSHMVTSYDYMYTRALNGRDTTNPYYSALCDINGSGLIDSTDWNAVLGLMPSSLPTGQPAGASNDAPTTSGVPLVEIDNDAIDMAISLYDFFDDLEDDDDELTYHIASSTNSAILDTLSVDSATGVLTVSAVSGGATGRSTVTVVATDSAGLSAETEVTIDVNRENEPPFIHEFWTEQFPLNTWLFSGFVTDPDDDVDGWIVTFSGALDRRVTVDENGYFEFAIILEPEQQGFVWAKTSDPHGAQSNQPGSWIGLT